MRERGDVADDVGEADGQPYAGFAGYIDLFEMAGFLAPGPVRPAGVPDRNGQACKARADQDPARINGAGQPTSPHPWVANGKGETERRHSSIISVLSTGGAARSRQAGRSQS